MAPLPQRAPLVLTGFSLTPPFGPILAPSYPSVTLLSRRPGSAFGPSVAPGPPDVPRPGCGERLMCDHSELGREGLDGIAGGDVGRSLSAR